MALSRRGILFSPSMKENRIEDYFNWPVSMRAENSDNKDKKKRVVDEIVRIGKIVFNYTVKVVGEFLLPKPQINFFPREFIEPDANATYIFPFFEKPRTLTTPVLAPKKPAPTELVLIKQRKKSRSNWCQTDSVLFEDIEKSPYFSFKFEEVKGLGLKVNGKKVKLGEVIESKSTDCESADFEKSVQRKVIRKVNRRNLGIVKCENLSITRSFNPVIEFQDSDQFMIIENEYCSMQGPSIQQPILISINEPAPDPNEKTTKKTSFFPISSPLITFNPQETSKSLPTHQIFQSIPPEQQPKVDLNPQLFQQNPPEPKILQSNPENTLNNPETNPFLNLNTVKKSEPCFVFGSSSCTPPTIQKNLFSHTIFHENSQSTNPNDVEMSSILPQILSPSSQNISIQTPNLETPCLFTQNNISNLYNKTPNNFPTLSSGSQLFTLPSNMTQETKPTSLFGIPNLSNPSTPQLTHFNLGKIASTSKKK